MRHWRAGRPRDRSAPAGCRPGRRRTTRPVGLGRRATLLGWRTVGPRLVRARGPPPEIRNDSSRLVAVSVTYTRQARRRRSTGDPVRPLPVRFARSRPGAGPAAAQPGRSATPRRPSVSRPHRNRPARGRACTCVGPDTGPARVPRIRPAGRIPPRPGGPATPDDQDEGPVRGDGPRACGGPGSHPDLPPVAPPVRTVLGVLIAHEGSPSRPRARVVRVPPDGGLPRSPPPPGSVIWASRSASSSGGQQRARRGPPAPDDVGAPGSRTTPALPPGSPRSTSAHPRPGWRIPCGPGSPSRGIHGQGLRDYRAAPPTRPRGPPRHRRWPLAGSGNVRSATGPGVPRLGRCPGGAADVPAAGLARRPGTATSMTVRPGRGP